MPRRGAGVRLTHFRGVGLLVRRRIWRITRQPLKHARVTPPSHRSNANDGDEILTLKAVRLRATTRAESRRR